MTELQVLCGSETGTLLLWDGENLAATVYGGNGKACHEGSIEILHYCEESKQVVTGGSDGCDKQHSLQSTAIPCCRCSCNACPHMQLVWMETTHLSSFRYLRCWIAQSLITATKDSHTIHLELALEVLVANGTGLRGLLVAPEYWVVYDHDGGMHRVSSRIS